MDSQKCNFRKSQVLIAMIIIVLSLLFLVGCTISINLTDTHGVATDVVDSTPTTTAETDANLSIPTTFP